ncbi:MAG: DNA helicase RecQ [Oscillospiraceae bacterium]
MNKQEILKQYFGHEQFRNGQAELIDALVSGRDVLGVMPTGAGKSACYQIPALLLPGITLVISPLISLMKDQVAALTLAGIPSAFINSSLSAAEYRYVFDEAESGAYKIIYVAPERLTAGDFLRFARQAKISLVAVDEAHCISQWGQDFRPGYLKISDFIDQLPVRPALGAFTATATTEVKADIIRSLRLKNALSVTTGFDRENLFFEVRSPKSKPTALLDLMRRNKDKSGIIYCSTRATVERVCDTLQEKGYPATRYHAGLSDEERRQNQEDFVYDRSPIIVATNAFGMGIDKSNVSFVVHYNMPKNLESYYQEAGRAGRDGERADCVLFFSAGDIHTAKFLIENSADTTENDPQKREALQQRDLERLAVMTGYCKTHSCLRAYILRYFGEICEDSCGNCGNCKAEFSLEDITIEAQKILSCVARVERGNFSIGAAAYIAILRGSRGEKVTRLGFDKLPTYGIMSDTSTAKLRDIIDFLLDEGYLFSTPEKYPVIKLPEKAGELLYHGARLEMPVKHQLAADKAEAPRRRRAQLSVELSPHEEDLFTQLKELRLQLAQEANVPSYVIFSNATLADMCAKKPKNLREFLEVNGVGNVKSQLYADAFLQVINHAHK